MMEFRVLPVTVSDNANVILQCKNQRALLIFLFRTKMFLSTCSAPFIFCVEQDAQLWMGRDSRFSRFFGLLQESAYSRVATSCFTCSSVQLGQQVVF